MTWLLASKMMRCDATSALKCLAVVILHFISRSGLLVKCFVSYTRVHRVGIMPFITRSHRQNYAMCVVTPCDYTLQVPLDTVFYSMFINHRFSFGKLSIRPTNTEVTRRLLWPATPLWSPKSTPWTTLCPQTIVVKPEEFVYMGKSGPLWRSKGAHKHFVLRLQVKIRNH